MNMEQRLIEFIARETGVAVSKIHLDSNLAEYFGIAGLDGDDLLESFGREFSVDVSNIIPEEYFGVESGANPFALFLVWLFPKLRPKFKPMLVRDLLSAIERKRLSS